jgi:hypothetical protein
MILSRDISERVADTFDTKHLLQKILTLQHAAHLFYDFKSDLSLEAYENGLGMSTYPDGELVDACQQELKTAWLCLIDVSRVCGLKWDNNSKSRYASDLLCLKSEITDAWKETLEAEKEEK